MTSNQVELIGFPTRTLKSERVKPLTQVAVRSHLSNIGTVLGAKADSTTLVRLGGNRIISSEQSKEIHKCIADEASVSNTNISDDGFELTVETMDGNCFKFRIVNCSVSKWHLPEERTLKRARVGCGDPSTAAKEPDARNESHRLSFHVDALVCNVDSPELKAASTKSADTECSCETVNDESHWVHFPSLSSAWCCSGMLL